MSHHPNHSFVLCVCFIIQSIFYVYVLSVCMYLYTMYTEFRDLKKMLNPLELEI